MVSRRRHQIEILKILRRRRLKRLEEKSKKVLQRHEENPIIEPRGEHHWEALYTFNPGAVYVGGKIHLIYRAVGDDWISRFGYAATYDGFHIVEREDRPIYERRPSFTGWPYSGGSIGGAEDPRVVWIKEDERIYMTYTAYGELRVGLTSIDVNDFLARRWNWRPEVLISPPGEIHKNFAIFPEKIRGKYAIIHSISPEIRIEYRKTLEFGDGEYIRSSYAPSSYPGGWEWIVKGVGPPPLKTREGWLVFYHGLDKRDPGKYKIGAMLLDKHHPEEILFRSKFPVLEPNSECETNGFKPGVVYSNGAVIKDDMILLYYGGADTYACVAYGYVDEFLDYLMEEKRPYLRRRRLLSRFRFPTMKAKNGGYRVW